MRAHKGFWSQESGFFYSSSGEPGFRQIVLHIWDLKDPKNPKFVGRAFLPSQRNGAPGFEGEYAHHPIVDEQNHRLYVAYRGAGQTTSWDISDPANPKLVWMVDTTPPGRGPHTISPIVFPSAGTSFIVSGFTTIIPSWSSARTPWRPLRSARAFTSSAAHDSWRAVTAAGP